MCHVLNTHLGHAVSNCATIRRATQVNERARDDRLRRAELAGHRPQLDLGSAPTGTRI